MIDFSTPIGIKIERRLREESTIWLTTVDSRNTPQPRPVWFQWDGNTVLVFSQQNAAKVRHIAQNSHVALNFNTDAGGGDVGVLIGEAEIQSATLPPERMNAYLKKYEEGIRNIGMTPESMQKEYPVVILVTPHKIRGF